MILFRITITRSKLLIYSPADILYGQKTFLIKNTKNYKKSAQELYSLLNHWKFNYSIKIYLNNHFFYKF